MSTYYYKSPTTLTESLVCLYISDEAYSEDTKTALATQHNVTVAVWTGDLPFSGYPIVEDGIMRQATVTELVDTGVRVLADNEVLLDGAIIKLAWNEEVVDGVVVTKPMPEPAPPTPPTTEELAERVRRMRDRRITSCDWIVSRHRDELDEGCGTTLDADEYAAWLAYRRALRDMPSEDGFPWDGGGELTPWPVETDKN